MIMSKLQVRRVAVDHCLLYEERGMRASGWIHSNVFSGSLSFLIKDWMFSELISKFEDESKKIISLLRIFLYEVRYMPINVIKPLAKKEIFSLIHTKILRCFMLAL